jgi:hypothetical protein
MVTFALLGVHFEQFPPHGGPCGVVGATLLESHAS